MDAINSTLIAQIVFSLVIYGNIQRLVNQDKKYGVVDNVLEHVIDPAAMDTEMQQEICNVKSDGFVDQKKM